MRQRTRMVVCASHSPGMERDTERVFGTDFRGGLAAAARSVREFAPERIVLFGGDHRRAFRHVVPSFGVALSAGILAEGGHSEGELDVPHDTAHELSEHLLRSGVDIAVCREIRLDHAFAQPLRDLLGGLREVPVIPVAVNCATPPLPTARRVLDVGRAVGAFLDGREERVLVIGTGGLSHSPPSMESDAFALSDEERAKRIEEGREAARKKIRPDWDRAFLEAMASWDENSLTTLTDEATARAGVGANEVRNWLAAAAAGGAEPLHTIRYEPVEEWITGMAVASSVPVSAAAEA
ncbi:3-carboxyethylcatechol 2,3-dioxygenase [Streptomyces sulphureus]|uniref:3-carboxyethylcatechol 2,3-dioxygenase n=1 Tax=Streptomyces sulphureus TaxID=47758 RepID=UPI00037BA20B|nr:3-carboxyethylcatechol 2,3-dioxygenase [Streptomyces sulphureus]